MRTSSSPPEDVALWALLWPLLVSACLGVVLEGPMGAMVFWTTLGSPMSLPEPGHATRLPGARRRPPLCSETATPRGASGTIGRRPRPAAAVMRP
jgi:hypothetical protein